MIVAQLAYNHLDFEVKAKCNALIAVPLPDASNATSNFVTAACWADDFKSQLGTGGWHYIDLPVFLNLTNGFAPDSSNVVYAINYCVSVLRNTNSPVADQAAALRYLIHFVGDIGQPLHCSTGISTSHPSGDAGGNLFYLTGDWGNLHSLWDDGGGFLMDRISRPLNSSGKNTLNNKVADIESAYPYTLSVGAIPDPNDWANEGWTIAKTVSYVGITNNTTPSLQYTNTVQLTTRQRMAIGGQRLAKLLETICVTQPPVLVAAPTGQGGVQLSWASVPGRSYRIQWSQQIKGGTWNDLTDVTGSLNGASYFEPAAQGQRFYRIVIVN